MSQRHLQDWISNQLGQMQPGECFPPTTTIAQHFGVSPATVRRAFKRYTMQGVLCSTQGKGTYLPKNPDCSELRGVARRRCASQIAEELGLLIAQGQYRRGEVLPSVKYLSLQFGLRPSTIIEALQILESRGLVSKVGRKRMVGRFGQNLMPPAAGRIACLLRKSQDAKNIFDPLSPAFPILRAIEREVIHNGYGFLPLVWHDLTKLIEPPGVTNEKIVGVLIPAHQDSEWGRKGGAGALLPRALEASLDHVRCVIETKESDSVVPSGISFWHSLAQYQAVAREIAQFAIARGYREVDVILDSREKGDGHVVLFVHLRDSLRGIGIATNLMFLATGASPVENHLRSGLAKRGIEVKNFSTDVSKNTLPSLWVFSNDHRALQAMRDTKGIVDWLGILTLEDSYLAKLHGISACLPDHERLGYVIAQALIGNLEGDRLGKGEIQGAAYIIDRCSTSRPRGGSPLV